MVNTRSTGSGSGQQQGQNNQGTGIPMPPSLTPEQYFQLQMQMMATLNNTVLGIGFLFMVRGKPSSRLDRGVDIPPTLS